MSQLTVSKLADESGISADAVRYYERIGLLAPPDRSASGYRLYDAGAVERVRFIKRAQRFGLRLEEIGGLLEIKEQGLCPCGHTRMLLERRARQLDAEIAEMNRLREDIEHMLHDVSAPSAQGWRCAGLSAIDERRETMTDEGCACGCTSTATADGEPGVCGCGSSDTPGQQAEASPGKHPGRRTDQQRDRDTERSEP